MKELKKIFLFVHLPVSSNPVSGVLHPAKYLSSLYEKWRQLIVEEGRDEEKGICILISDKDDPKEKEFGDFALKHFGARGVVVDPDYKDPEVMVLLAQDLEQTFRNRGAYEQWIPYELWSSMNARFWAEGFKKRLAIQGYSFDPTTVEFESCGEAWDGCLAKYTSFMGRYLGLSKPIERIVELCPLTNFLREANFVECVAIDHHVRLFLFGGKYGRPVAQFFDGMRGVWEKPHIVTVAIDPKKVSIITTSPNLYVKVRSATKILENKVIVDVGDGCHPAITTLIGKNTSFDEFKAALTTGKVTDKEEPLPIAPAIDVYNDKYLWEVLAQKLI